MGGDWEPSPRVGPGRWVRDGWRGGAGNSYRGGGGGVEVEVGGQRLGKV